MKSIASLGLLINPSAGRGFAENARIGRMIVQKFPGAKILTGPAQLGEAALAGIEQQMEVYPCDVPPGREQSIHLAGMLARQGVEMIVAIGGDGTLADVALGLVDAKDAPPILGVGVGSTNVGPLVTCRADEIDTFRPDRLVVTSIPAIQISHGGTRLGLGFNDCAIGFTVVGTLDGKICDVDAASKMQGKTTAGTPGVIGTPLTRVERLVNGSVQEIARGAWIGTVIIGFAERAFIGKAVTGGVCLASYAGVPAGCLVADAPLVTVGLSQQDVLNQAPVATRFVSFDQEMQIEVEGVCQGASINVDGTPLMLLTPSDRLSFTVMKDFIHSIQMM